MTPPPDGPLVSIAVAAWNREEMVLRAVRSALNQTYPRLEVVVSDDFSQDRTVESLRAIADPRLRVITHAGPVGVWENWTAALRQTTGEFLAFLGDDDYLSPTFVADHLAVFDAHPEVVMVASPYQEEMLSGERGRLFAPPFPPGSSAGPDEFFHAVAGMQMFFGAGLFRRREAWAVWETTREDDLSADHGMLLRLAVNQQARVATCPTLGYRKTTHAGSLSAKYVRATTGLRNVILRVRAENRATPRQRHLLARLGALESITLARHYAAERDLAAARRELLLALRVCPSLTTAWRQLILLTLFPSHVVRTSRLQRGLPES